MLPTKELTTILLVDDELAVQRFISSVLQRNGYHVLESKNTVHALEICRDHPGLIHLLITDVLMPEMNGRELAEKALAIRQTMRVLYISGYVDPILMHGFCLDSTIAFLQKPFSSAALLRKVQQVLEAQIY